MAKPKPKPKYNSQSATRSQAEIARMLLLERLGGPILPGILAALALLVWVLSGAGVIAPDRAILWLGTCAILAALFFGLRRFLGERLAGAIPALLALFALAYAGSTLFTLWRTVSLESPIATGELAPKGAPLDVKTEGHSGPFRVVIEGHLPPTQEQASQSERYEMTVSRGGAVSETFDGEFNERWGQRRLGRRGTAPVHTVRNVDQHDVADPDGAGFQLALQSLVPAEGRTVTVNVHPDPFPLWPMVALGALLTAAALALDAWRSVDPGDATLTAFTLAGLLGIAAFRRFAPAHPGLPELIFNATVGGLAGWALSSALWAMLRKPLGGWFRG
ncbi:MAG: hypothetical protein RL698_1083 [Pseudomonadota bacterium]|jgi:hypothetical protein